MNDDIHQAQDNSKVSFLSRLFNPQSKTQNKDKSLKGSTQRPQNSEQKRKAAGGKKRKPQTQGQSASVFNDPRSIIDFLPVVEYLQGSQTFLLNDGYSVMKVFDTKPVATEGRSQSFLNAQRNLMQDTFQDVFDEHAPGEEWNIWTYAYYDDNLDEYIDSLRNYPVEHAKGTEYTNTYLKEMEAHLRGVCQENGIFTDDIVTDSAWGGAIARCKVVIYRRLRKNQKLGEGVTPESELNDVCKKFEVGMRECGISLKVCDGVAYYDWMVQWFNPAPQITGGDKQKLRQLTRFNSNDELPFGDDFSESFFFEAPRSSLKHKCWVFDGKPHRFLRVHKIRKTPSVACMTGEVKSSEGSNKAASLMDKLPPGSIIVSGIIVTSQTDIENHIARIEKKAKGDSSDALYAMEDCAIAKGILGKKQKLFRGMMGIYLRADNLRELRKATIDASTYLLNAGLQPVVEEAEMVGVDAYLFHLPGVFEPKLDKSYKASRPIWAQHLLNLSGFFGRGTGTGNPGLMFFNRGGEPWTADPLSLKDRAKNAHMIINGPTGSGKSASLTAIAAHVMAVHRPRLFMLELGNSFGLLGDYFKANGLTVNKVQITPEQAAAGLVNLPPFADAHMLLSEDEKAILGSNIHSDVAYSEQVEMPETTVIDGERVNTADLSPSMQEKVRDEQVLKTIADEVVASNSPTAKRLIEAGKEEEGSEQRDIMGECEIIATLMITGGEPEETKKLTRADRRMIRDAILIGARAAVKDSRTTTVSDVCGGFVTISKNQSIPEKRRERAFEMGESMRMFTDGFEGDMFNSSANESWPEADVTIVDVATLGREGYQAQLAIAYSSILMKVNNIAEKHQHGSRQNLMLTDESHIVTTNPLLAGYIVKIVKTWRKLQTWGWYASQNVKDYPDQAAKLLNMCEWFFMLVMPSDEVNDLDRFRPVTDSQKQMMLSATKAHRKYTEGVMLSDRTESLVRMVPPSLMLSLAGTEGDEKAERGKYMKQFGITEVEAAIYVAQMIDYQRGLRAEMPKDPIAQAKYAKESKADAVELIVDVQKEREGFIGLIRHSSPGELLQSNMDKNNAAAN